MTVEALERPTSANTEVAALTDRVGRVHMNQRLYLQAVETAREQKQGKHFHRGKDARRFYVNLYYALKAVGMYGYGYRNFRDVRIRKHEMPISRLPPPFDGFTILQLSDLHLDLDASLTPVIEERIRDLKYDLCVITGDYRANTSGDFSESLSELEKLVPSFTSSVFGILGNHDFIEMVPALEAMGVRMLVNESATIHSGCDELHLCGIDDPHLYQLDNFEKTLDGVPEDCVSILLSHSPETFRRAAAAGFDVMLSGHTHGGQICLPGGVAIHRIGRCPGYMLSGAWRYRGMQGYTSVGTGSCGVPVRFFCPPEITLHTLRAAS